MVTLNTFALAIVAPAGPLALVKVHNRATAEFLLAKHIAEHGQSAQFPVVILTPGERAITAAGF
jgi:hypothetical protein